MNPTDKDKSENIGLPPWFNKIKYQVIEPSDKILNLVEMIIAQNNYIFECNAYLLERLLSPPGIIDKET